MQTRKSRFTATQAYILTDPGTDGLADANIGYVQASKYEVT